MIIQPLISSNLKSSFSVREASKAQKISLLILETAAISSFVASAALFCTCIPVLQTAAVVLALASVATAMVWTLSFYSISSSIRLRPPPETSHLNVVKEEHLPIDIPSEPLPHEAGCKLPAIIKNAIETAFTGTAPKIAPIVRETLDTKSKDLIDSLRRRFPQIFYRKDFLRFYSESVSMEEDLSLMKPFIEEIVFFILKQNKEMNTPWDEESLSGYLSTIIRYFFLAEEETTQEDLLQFSTAFFHLVPFLIQLYRSLGPKRVEIFSWLKSKDLALFDLLFHREEFTKIAHLHNSILFLFRRILSLTEPFALFLEEDRDRRATFLHQFLHLITFSLLPYLLAQKQKDLTKREEFISRILTNCESFRAHLDSAEDAAIKPLLKESLSL